MAACPLLSTLEQTGVDRKSASRLIALYHSLAFDPQRKRKKAGCWIGKDEPAAKSWILISMKDGWKTIFPRAVTKQ